MVWNSVENGTRYSGGEIMTQGFNALSILYMIGLLLPLLFMVPMTKGLILVAVGLLTFAWAQTQSTKYEFGSMWCLVAVLYAVAAIMV